MTTTNSSSVTTIAGLVFGTVLLTIGILNIILVHPVPGIIYIMISMIYFPPVTHAIYVKTGLIIPALAKILIGAVVIWFTLGISDLAEIAGL